MGGVSLPIVIIVAYESVLQSLFYLVNNGVAVGVGHYESLGTGAFLGILLHKGIVLGYLPLLVVKVGIGFVVGLALGVAIGLSVIINRTEPTTTNISQNIIGLHCVCDPHFPILDVEADDRCYADRVFVDGSRMLHNVLDD